MDFRWESVKDWSQVPVDAIQKASIEDIQKYPQIMNLIKAAPNRNTDEQAAYEARIRQVQARTVAEQLNHDQDQLIFLTTVGVAFYMRQGLSLDEAKKEVELRCSDKELEIEDLRNAPPDMLYIDWINCT